MCSLQLGEEDEVTPPRGTKRQKIEDDEDSHQPSLPTFNSWKAVRAWWKTSSLNCILSTSDSGACAFDLASFHV